MSGSPEEVNKVLDIVNRTEYMRGYDARNEELKNDSAMSMITEQVKRLREQAELIRGKHYMTTYLDEAADTIEMLAAKLQAVNKKTMFSYFDGIADSMKEEEKELEAYRQAFEDIRAELDGYDDTDLIKVKYVRQFIDKHNPDKVGKESGNV